MIPSRWLPLALAVLLPAAASAQIGGVVRDRPQAVRRGTAAISGRVVTADSGRPLRFARVTITAPELGDARVTTTDEDGVFEHAELPAGHYTVTASRSGYIAVSFGQRRPLRPGRPIEVRDGQRVRDVDFRLPRGSAIMGRVLDQDGEPLVRARITAMRYRFAQGERRVEPGGSAETDDRGQFRVYGLSPGTYFVTAAAQATDTSFVAVPGRNRGGGTVADSFDAPGSLTYAPTYYPGVAALSDAAPITVPLADEVSGVDFSLQLVTAARVTGIVVSSTGAAEAALVMLVRDDLRNVGGGFYSGQARRDGSFSIANVPPGRYLAVARGSGRGQRDMSPPVLVSVSGPLVSDVNLVLAPSTGLQGQVTFAGAASPPTQDLTRIRIAVWSPMMASVPLGGGQSNATPRADGSFAVPNVGAGTYVVRVSNLPKGCAVKAIYLDGREVTDEPFELRAGDAPSRLTIAVTDRATTLTGVVRDERDQPLSDYTVIAFAADSNLWRAQSRFIQAVRPDRNGVYTIQGLPPGEYLVRATDDVDQGEWYDPELLQTLRAGAARVLLQEGDAKTVDLKSVASSQ